MLSFQAVHGLSRLDVCVVLNSFVVCIAGPEQYPGRRARAGVSRLSNHSRWPHGPQGCRVQETGEGHAPAVWSCRRRADGAVSWWS